MSSCLTVCIQHGLAALRDEQRLGPWMYRVARSAIVDHQRATAKHTPGALSDGHSETAGIVPAFGAEWNRASDTSNTQRELARYASPYREALTLTELQGLTQKQAAEMLGISLSGMKSRVQRGRQQLRRALETAVRSRWTRAAGIFVRTTPEQPLPRPQAALLNEHITDGCLGAHVVFEAVNAAHRGCALRTKSGSEKKSTSFSYGERGLWAIEVSELRCFARMFSHPLDYSEATTV